jgi:Na+/proline symporter
MNLLAFILVLAAGILGAIVAFLNWKEKGSAGFLLGLAVGLLSAGVIVNEVLTKWSHSVHQ